MTLAASTRILSVLPAILSAGCLGLVPSPAAPTSWGNSSDGLLFAGASLPDRGEGFVRARPGEETRFGTPVTVSAMRRAAASVHRTYPGGEPLRIGDLSYPAGGRHPRHRSHRSGRDVDVIFYVTDTAGRSTRGRGWLAFDRFGVARETTSPGDAPPSGDLFFFDDARNWHFVRTLLLDPEARVQWIFVSRGLKSRLLAYAISHETDPEAIFRAAWVLHQPSRGNPHADHFHIRFSCTPEERTAGCWDRGPVWPWIRRDVEKPAGREGVAVDDETLIEALLGEPPVDEATAGGPHEAGQG